MSVRNHFKGPKSTTRVIAYVLQPLQSLGPVARAQFAISSPFISVSLPLEGHRCRHQSRRAVDDRASVIRPIDGCSHAGGSMVAKLLVSTGFRVETA